MAQFGLEQRVRLAALIKKHRERCGLTQQDLGDLLYRSQATVHRLESGSHPIQVTIVQELIILLTIPDDDAQHMLDLANFTSTAPSWSGDLASVPDYARAFLEREQIASVLISWHQGRIPGPLQSDQYMLKFFNADANGTTNVTPQMANSRRRRAIFTGPHLRRYGCILAEEALRRIDSSYGHAVARDQIDHLLAVNDPDDPRQPADRRTLVQILPIEAEVRYLANDFSVLRVLEPASDAVYVEHVFGGLYKVSTAAAEKALSDWALIADAALNRDDTNAFLQKLRVEFTIR